MRRKILTYFCCVFLILSSISVFAERPPEPPQNQPSPPGLPIDGGISFLIISGAFLGVYAIRKKFTIDDF
ncbi:MAG: hypothetical protein Q8S41_14005 [Lutibacter sp.]|nr:hypothetical protein [Lutibacter sp.]